MDDCTSIHRRRRHDDCRTRPADPCKQDGERTTLVRASDGSAVTDVIYVDDPVDPAVLPRDRVTHGSPSVADWQRARGQRHYKAAALMPDRPRPATSPPTQRTAGLTLTELLVAMVVFRSRLPWCSQPVHPDVQRRSDDRGGEPRRPGQVRQRAGQIDRQARSGNVLVQPRCRGAADGTVGCQAVSGSNAGTCMRVYTQANGAEKCVQWQVLADGAGSTTSTLRSRGWETDWLTTTPTLVVPWDVVARGLVGTPSQAPFTLDTGSAYGSRLLNLRFEAVDPRRGNDPTVLTSSLSGRNTNYGYDAGQCTPVPPAT